MEINSNNILSNDNRSSNLKMNFKRLNSKNHSLRQSAVQYMTKYIEEFIKKNRRKKSLKQYFLDHIKKEINLDRLDELEKIFDDLLNKIITDKEKNKKRDLTILGKAKITKNKKQMLLAAKNSKKNFSGGE
tara:strand:- start:702 stop:1094 length:393 start_codon:yes stop_codon:yes gene_type:complete